MGDELTYLIWSNEHGAWWMPGGFGYTPSLPSAGRFDQERAAAIVASANEYLESGRQPNEVMVVAPEHAWHGRR